MKHKYASITTVVILAFLSLRCSINEPLKNKINSKDPFRETIVKSEFFKVATTKDTVIRGSQGTLLVFQEGSIVDGDGDYVEGKVDIELAEAFKIEDMLRSNLTTISNGELLETDGMIYFNLFRGDEQLYINPAKPVHIEIPTRSRKPNMQVYEDIRDENGNMNWANPIPIENYLNPVDIFSLDLLPDGFAEAVEKEMPFRNHKKASEVLIDSLYYSLHFANPDELVEESIPANLDVRERFDNDGFPESELDSLLANYKIDEDNLVNYGVDPAVIKTLKTSEFQNTIISTKEFQERLQAMFKICRTDMIDVYIKNLDKNLWEVDSIAASLLDDNVYQEDFNDFAAQKWTTLKDSDVNTELLKDFYSRSLGQIKDELATLRNEAVKSYNEKTTAAKKIVAEYQTLLDKREAFRMTSYGFQRTITGWINIDRGVQEKSREYQPFRIIVTESSRFDRTYAYIIFKSMKSLYRLNSNDQRTFYVGNEQRREMITPKNNEAIAIVISYVEDTIFFSSKEYKTGAKEELRFDDLSHITEGELRSKLSQFGDYPPKNSVLSDLRYLDKIWQEKIRENKLEHERIVMALLSEAAFPIDSSYMRYNREFQIDMQIDTCINKVKNARPWK